MPPHSTSATSPRCWPRPAVRTSRTTPRQCACAAPGNDQIIKKISHPSPLFQHVPNRCAVITRVAAVGARNEGRNLLGRQRGRRRPRARVPFDVAGQQDAGVLRTAGEARDAVDLVDAIDQIIDERGRAAVVTEPSVASTGRAVGDHVYVVGPRVCHLDEAWGDE